MFKLPRRRHLLVILALAASAAFAAVAYANHSWGGYHWARTSNPFTLKLGDNLTTADWKSHLSQTSRDWNSGQGTPVLTAIAAVQSNKRCSMVAGTTQVCNGSTAITAGSGWPRSTSPAALTSRRARRR
jgi:hypothetical protein